MLLEPKFYDTEKCIFLAFVSGHQKVHTQQNDNIAIAVYEDRIYFG